MQPSLSVECNGSVDVIDNNIKQISSVVGGFLVYKKLAPNLTVWLNDGHQEKRQEKNEVATAIAEEAGVFFPIYGKCVFTGGCDEEESPLPLSPGWMKSIYIGSVDFNF